MYWYHEILYVNCCVYVGCFVTLCQYLKILILRPFPVRNIIWMWIHFSRVTEMWVFEMQVDLGIIVYLLLWKNILQYSLQYSLWRKDCTVQFNKCSEWLPSSWMHALTLSTVESITLWITAVSLTCPAGLKICWSCSPIVSTLNSYNMFFCVTPLMEV